MKHFLSFVLWLLFSGCLPAHNLQRQTLVFDYHWQFHLCKDSVEVEQWLQTLQQDNSIPFDTVQIPHDWSIGLPIDPKEGGASGYLAGGQGLYVKDFELPATFETGQKVAIYFEGAYHRASVWLNGHLLGYHMYGYTPFEFDMTPYLNPRGKNRLVVHLNTEEKSRWYTGAGLYRHIRLIITSASHLSTWGVFAETKYEHGQWVLTPQTSLVNGQECSTSFQLLDANGQVLLACFDQQATIPTPHLWTLEDPYLYILRTHVYDREGHEVDSMDTPFGLRQCVFDADHGFLLNGQPLKIKGVCLHQDAGTLGVAMPDRAIERRLQALKAFGCNAIRSAHHPASEELLTICDTLGLLVIDEAFDKWKSGYYEPFFDEHAVGDLSDMVIAHRNHPSIVAWSIGNEVQEAWADDNTGIDRARLLNDVVHHLDPTRPTLLAGQQGFRDAFGEVTDVMGYNYLEPRMIHDHKRHPKRKMLVTEAFVYYSGLREDIVRDWEERNPWNFVEENKFIAGSFLWAGVDYHGESSPWPAKGWCSCPFDMTLLERPQAAYFHTVWKPEEPYLKLVVRDNCFDQAIGTDHWQYPIMADTWDLPFEDGRTVQIRCYTTCDSVQFYFPMWSNPQLPLKPRITSRYTDHTITIQLPARKGKILAVGYKNGQPMLRDSLINHGPVTGLKIENDVPMLHALPADLCPTGGCQQNLSHIRLWLVDQEGRLQQMDPRKITVSLTGPGRLLGIETGDFRRNGFTGNSITSYFGSALLRIQSTQQTGIIQVTIAVEGLTETYAISIPVIP